MKTNAKKREFPYVALILIVTLVLVVAIVGYTVVDSLGVIAHFDNAGKSKTFKINENHLDVYRYHVAQSQLMTQFMYYQYGLMQDTYGIVETYGSAANYANAMIPSSVGTGSYDENAYNYAKQYLTYCEGATEAGMYDQLKKDTAKDIDDYIDGLKETAKINGVSFSNFLKKWIGNGVSENDVRTAMEYYYIGIEYAELLHDKYGDAVTDEELIKYRDDNKSTFYTTEYTSYKLVNNDMKTAFESCKTVDDVKTAIVDYYMNQKFADLYKTNITNKSITDVAGQDKTKADVRTTILALNKIGDAKEVFTSDQTGDYQKAAYTITTAINTSVKTELGKIADEGEAKYADPTASTATDLQKWLFADGRKAGDYNLIETKNTSTDSTTGKETTTLSYTWYVVEKVMVLDEEHTKNAYYVNLTDDAADVKDGLTAVEKGEAMYKALEADKTPEKFAELVKKYAEGASTEIFEKISFENIEKSSEDLANWLFDKNRKEGDITKVSVKDTKDEKKITNVYVAYYVDENEETWKYDCRDAVAGEKVNEWYEDAVTKYEVVMDYEFATEAPTSATTTAASTPATTTAASTSATTEPESDPAESDTAA